MHSSLKTLVRRQMYPTNGGVEVGYYKYTSPCSFLLASKYYKMEHSICVFLQSFHRRLWLHANIDLAQGAQKPTCGGGSNEQYRSLRLLLQIKCLGQRLNNLSFLLNSAFCSEVNGAFLSSKTPALQQACLGGGWSGSGDSSFHSSYSLSGLTMAVFGKPIKFWAKFLCWFSLKQGL